MRKEPPDKVANALKKFFNSQGKKRFGKPKGKENVMLFSVFEHPNKQETNNTDGLLSFEEQLINSVGFGIYQEKVIIGSVRVSFLGYPSEMSVFKDGKGGEGTNVVYKSNENDWLLFSLSSRDVYHNLFFSFLGKHFLLFFSPSPYKFYSFF